MGSYTVKSVRPTFLRHRHEIERERESEEKEERKGSCTRKWSKSRKGFSFGLEAGRSLTKHLLLAKKPGASSHRTRLRPPGQSCFKVRGADAEIAGRIVPQPLCIVGARRLRPRSEPPGATKA
ncbi:hypothetical protein EVAR_13727_1 [Eumeta japonica]|uniref:Uncharacterized protein n=1 Tax=Eumeta variegata TaxID=151549 RepID=A0A4C1UCC1_EUMVA|nr:hypothetical protein EVAR_13727_1 [Eumeta japonica]